MTKTSIPSSEDTDTLLQFLPQDVVILLKKDLCQGDTPVKKKNTAKKNKSSKPVLFDYDMVNCNQNLKELTTKLKSSKIKQYGMLLWGVSGSGKSHYAKWLAQELKMPIIKKRASDLIDKWVGQTEQNIRAAFKEAEENKAILLIDEADSFLFDRTNSDRDYQASKVNEVLVCMEDHAYPFIMTTNLKDKIDRAALRRFIFKIKFDYMTNTNVIAGIKTYFGKDYALSEEQIQQLKYLTAGDFKISKAKLDILEDGKYTNELIFKYLLHEQKEKDIKAGSNKIII